MNNNNKECSIRELYQDKVLFITGASGFCGKSLVQRFLETCDVKIIYVLLRGKKGQTYAERFQAYREDEIFSWLPKEKLLKIFPVEGDLVSPSLGLNPEDYDTLIREVNVVFHCAASIHLFEPLKPAMQTQVYGTKSVLDLCKRMVNLDCMVHTSSLVAWNTQPDLKEALYRFPVDPKRLLAEIEPLSVEQAEKKYASRYLGRYPKYLNSYAFTKTLSEILLDEYSEDINIACARLPYITGAAKSPQPGWFGDFIQSGNAGFAAYSLGIFRTPSIRPETKSICIPLDSCSNALIAIGWDRAMGKKKLEIYNMSYDPHEYFTVYEAQVGARDLGLKFPSILQLAPPAEPAKTRAPYLYLLMECYCLIMIAHIVDFSFWLKGKKPPLPVAKMIKILVKINLLGWEVHKESTDMCLDNIHRLYGDDGVISEEEKKVFYFNNGIDWHHMGVEAVLRFRRKFLHEPDSNIPAAVARLERLVKIYWAVFYSAIVVCVGLIAFFVFG